MGRAGSINSVFIVAHSPLVIDLNPYVIADKRQAAARWRGAAWGERLAPLWPMVGAAAALPLLRGSVYAFLDRPNAIVYGVSGLVLRLALLLAAALCLSSFGTLIRGPDRGVIDLHPLKADLWLKARLRSMAWGYLPWLGAALVLLFPLQGTGALGAAAAVVVGAWGAGLGLGLGVNLSAAVAGESGAWASTLDAIRGVNPRAQAALIYAPGMALGLAGLSVIGAVYGLEGFLLGDTSAVFALVLPWLAAGVGLGLAWQGRQQFSRIPRVLGEVDAAWAAQEDPAEAREVYLGWLVPRMPVVLRLALLKDLRQGWRSFRSTLTGSWFLSLLCAAAGWTTDPVGQDRAGFIVGVGCGLLGILGLRMSAADPPWLAQALPLPWGRRLGARSIALWAWCQPLIVAAVLMLGIRQGAWSLALTWEFRALLLAVLGAGVGLIWRRREI